ncbi:hypothetical protein TTHERM_000958789 (macronuclear) [Tetrahymena thermophila SB210]|uniref:Uncharacterized protein n=1 Tax=Tetrahymena thermophila (strain SB210) TaxID=312017 RepID=W7XIE5_TETTS|nr:hypothetical protein TTHERM_000958789 [Tetrahymena thermophila SB210]EWS73224.1 hypothetical protein TTHERM_000958789 [Tetrahymena thermophila SB210]|eukprot:XP_012654256.1 hypothetical protein TTHERM_000958789 [Tetrahymena thermophila SB210]
MFEPDLIFKYQEPINKENMQLLKQIQQVIIRQNTSLYFYKNNQKQIQIFQLAIILITKICKMTQ